MDLSRNLAKIFYCGIQLYARLLIFCCVCIYIFYLNLLLYFIEDNLFTLLCTSRSWIFVYIFFLWFFMICYYADKRWDSRTCCWCFKSCTGIIWCYYSWFADIKFEVPLNSLPFDGIVKCSFYPLTNLVNQNEFFHPQRAIWHLANFSKRKKSRPFLF